MNKVATYNPVEFATVKDGAALAGCCYLTALKKVNAAEINPVAFHQVPNKRGRPSPLYKRSEVEEALGLVDVAAEAEAILAAGAVLAAFEGTEATEGSQVEA